MLTCARYHNTRNMLGERRGAGELPARRLAGSHGRPARGAARTGRAGAAPHAARPARRRAARHRADALNSRPRGRRHNNCRAAACSRAGRTPYRFIPRTFRESKKLTRSNTMRSIFCKRDPVVF